MKELGTNLLNFFRVKEYELIIYRIWICIIAFFLPIYGVFIKYFLPDAIEELEHRLIVTFIGSALLVASYKNDFVKKHLALFVLLLDFAAITWGVWVVVINNFSPEYSIGLFLSFCCLSAIRRNIIEMLVYVIYFLILIGIAFMSVQDVSISLEIYALSILIITTVTLLSFLRKNYIDGKLQKLNSNLEQKNQELEKFVYVASHDLKTPIRTIGSFASLMKRRLGNDIDDNIKEYIAFIMDGVNNMSSIIDDLLLYAQYGFDKAKIEDVSPTNLINEVWTSVSTGLADVKLVLPKKEIPIIQARHNQIKQLFQNLFENSLKYNLSSTKIITIEYTETNKFHVFSVNDNGIGIDEAYETKIFEMFQRLHTKAQFPGTGIGLAVCKRIITNHNGDIALKRTKKTGTTFEFSIAKNLENEVSLIS